MDKSTILFGQNGSYTISSAEHFHGLYYPLFHEHGLKSAITPTLHGDLKLDHNHFATMPSSIEDLSNPLHARNVFFRV
ncbi:MAG: hypothetical protein AB7S88_05680, partial [Candidatus Izemoplasmatales bacterium]